MSDDREARIRERAYHLWIERGRPEGREQEHWEEARRSVEQDDQTDVAKFQDHRGEASGKPELGSVIEDHRPSEPPVNQSDEPVPVHAEKELAPTTGKSGTRTKRTAASAKAEATTPPKPRKGKVKSGTMETT